MARKVQPLTNVQVQKARPAPADFKLSDGDGLFLLITTGGSKLWRLKYRFGGKEKLLALGAYPEISLARAREARRAAKEALASGLDPAAEKKREALARQLAAGNTFGAIADEYIEKQIREGRADRTLTKLRWLLDFARPALDKRPIAEITAPEVLAVLKTVERRGRLETARRLRSTIGSVFRFAIATARAESDPTFALRGALVTPKVTSRAAILDPVALGGLLRAIDGFDGQVTTKAALQLMALLFPRPGELRMAEWREFDLQGAVWTIPAERTKMRRPHKIPLSRQAIDILAGLHSITGGGRLVFPGTRSVERCISENTLNAALRRLGYAKDEATSHGFRATASTLLNECGKWNPDAIERALSHVDGDEIRRAYARGEHWSERVEMMNWWADHLDVLRRGADVIPLRPGRTRGDKSE